MIIVVDRKKALSTVPMPVGNMWCARTNNRKRRLFSAYCSPMTL